VETWYWQVWNEANIVYWQGTPEEFYKLHDYAVAAVRRALPTAVVGGMDSAGGGEPLRAFLEHCVHGTNHATGEVGTPLDFVSFHAKGSPKAVDGRVRMGIADHLSTINSNFQLIASFPELKDIPIIIGESDPDGCAACRGTQYGYRNTALFASYTAATLGREQALAERAGVNLQGALTWAFQFEGYPLFAGFRALASGGINLPVLNVFRMFAQMHGQRVVTQSSAEVPLDAIAQSGVRADPDVSALACLDGNTLYILAWHYHDDDIPGPAAEVEITIGGLPPGITEASLREYRIDQDHSNAFTAWQRMGSPLEPTPEQYLELEEASELTTVNGYEAVPLVNGNVILNTTLPRQGVSLFVVGT
jgi:xylan 1,4-beta-xylosidase